MKRSARSLLLAAIICIAFALRVVRLDFQPLWWDEGYSLFFATRDFGTMLERTAVDIHPPFYYALLQLWMAFAGRSDVAVRLLSVAIGVATIPLLYALARRLFSDVRVALMAALLLALSPLHVYYSQEVRMYGLVTLLGLASVYLFVQLLDMSLGKPKTVAVAAAYILATTAALYAQYYAAFILALEILVVLILAIRQRQSAVHWLAAWFAIALLYLPWMIYAGPKLYAYVTEKVAHEAYPPLDPMTYLAQHLAAFSTGHLTEWTWLAWGSVVLIALALLGAIETRRQGDKVTRRNCQCLHVPLSPGLLVSLSLLVPLALGFLVNLRFPFHPVHTERLLLFAAPSFYLLAALGIRALWDRRAVWGALALLIAALISAASLYDFYTVPRYPNDDYRPLVAETQTVAQPGDVFLAIYPWQIGYLETYYTGAPLTIVETPNDVWINHPAQMKRELDALREKGARVWLPALQTLGRILEDALDAYLREHAYSVVDNWYGTTRLELFAFAADPPLPHAPRPIAFEDNVTLSEWGISDEPAAAGQDIVRAQFNWDARASAGFNASLRLLDQKGNLWAQDDREITQGTQRIGFAVPAGTPPGEYDLRLMVYRARDNYTLRLTKDPSQDNVSLTVVHVMAPAQPNLAAIPHRAQVDFENGVRLLGYDAPPTLHPGILAPTTLFWQTARTLDKEYAVALQIQDARGNVYATTQAAPARGIYPTIGWQPNELVRDPETITLRADTPDGSYRLAVALVDAASNTRSPLRDIGTVTVKGRLHYFGAPTPSYKMDVRFGEIARVVGYDLNGDPRTVRLVLYWQALASSQTSYTVFVHILDANDTLRAQRDQIPGAGAYPTTTWVKGEYLVDVYDISIPRDAPTGDYKTEIGMYDATTGARLPAFDMAGQPSGDSSTLPTRISVAP